MHATFGPSSGHHAEGAHLRAHCTGLGPCPLLLAGPARRYSHPFSRVFALNSSYRRSGFSSGSGFCGDPIAEGSRCLGVRHAVALDVLHASALDVHRGGGRHVHVQHILPPGGCSRCSSCSCSRRPSCRGPGFLRATSAATATAALMSPATCAEFVHLSRVSVCLPGDAFFHSLCRSATFLLSSAHRSLMSFGQRRS